MANLFDKLRLAAGSGSLTAERSKEKQGTSSPDLSKLTDITAKPVEPASRPPVAGAGPTESTQTSSDLVDTSTKPQKSVKLKIKKSKDDYEVSSKSTPKKGSNADKSVSKKHKTKTKSSADLSSAPPKKVAKTDIDKEKGKKKKPQSTSSQLSDSAEEEPKPKKVKRSKSEEKAKLLDARPAFEPLTKPFVIPRRKKSKDIGLLQDVPLDSREYLRDIQPLVMKQYRDVASRGRFLFTKAKVVHNEDLSREFMEQKKVLKEEGRNDKDLAEHYAFYCVETESEANDICQNGMYANGGPTFCLGNAEMGVYLSRHSDIIKRGPMVNGQQGFLIVFKIMRGKVKAMQLNYTSAIEPTPNYDCHVAKDSDTDVLKLGPVRAFDYTQIYLYEYGELDLEKRPKQIVPYAVIQFVYKDPHKKHAEREALAMGTVPQRSPSHSASSSPASTPSRHSGSTPSRHQSSTPSSRHQTTTPSRHPSGGTPSRQVATPLKPSSTPSRQHAMPTSEPASNQPVIKKVDAKDYKRYGKHSYKLWKGNLICKGQKTFTGLIVSYSSPIVPQKMPTSIELKKEVPVQMLRSAIPAPIFNASLPIVSMQKEVVVGDGFYLYSELKQVRDKSEDETSDKAKRKSIDTLMKYLTRKSMALKVNIDRNIILYLLPTSKFTDELGITGPGYPIVLHALFASNVPTISHLTGKGIHLPKDFRRETAINTTEPDHANRQRDIRRSMHGFFAEQKTIAMGESQKQCRVEMQPEYRTSQSVYSPGYTGTTGAGLLPIPTVSSRGHAEHGHGGHYSRQYSSGNLVSIPMSPAHSESGSSSHSSSQPTSPMYDPDAPIGGDPRLKAHRAYTSTSQVDPRLARSMGAKESTVPASVPKSRTEQPPSPSQQKQTKEKYMQLQKEALEYAKQKLQKKKEKDYHIDMYKQRRGSNVECGVPESLAAKRQRHLSEPDYREQVLLQLTAQTLEQLETDKSSSVLQGSTQLMEFRGMIKQQQQVLELQSEMKRLRETRRISAEGLPVGATAEDLESAYQAKVGELQKTLQSLLQQRQRLGSSSSSEGSLDQSSHAAVSSQEANVSELLTQVKNLGDSEAPPVETKKSAIADPRKRAPSDPRKKGSQQDSTKSDPRRLAPGDPRKLPGSSKPVLLRQISDASQSSDGDGNFRAELANQPYQVVMEIESPDPEEQAGITIPRRPEVKDTVSTKSTSKSSKSKDFGTELAAVDRVKKPHTEKTKDKKQPVKEKQQVPSDVKTDPAKSVQQQQQQQQKTGVELLWERAEDSLTDASDDLYDPSKPTATIPDSAAAEKMEESASEANQTTEDPIPVSPIRGANEMKDFLNSSVETPSRVVPSGQDKEEAAEEVKVAEEDKPALSAAAQKKIKSAKDMSSYLNKQLQDLEKEKKERNKRKKAAKGKELDDSEDDDPQTIEEIDAMIKKLHKLKHAKLKAEQQKKQKKKPPVVEKPATKTKPAKTNEGKENTEPKITAKPKGPRKPTFGEEPLTRLWSKAAGPVHGIILGPGPDRTISPRKQLKPVIEDKRKVKVSKDGKKIGVEILVNDVDVKTRKKGMDSGSQSCIMYMLHHRFAVDDKEPESKDDVPFVDSVLEAIYHLNNVQQAGANRERQRKVVEVATKLEKRKLLSEERLESGEDDEVELVTENVFGDLDNAKQGSIRLEVETSTEGGKAHKAKTESVDEIELIPSLKITVLSDITKQNTPSPTKDIRKDFDLSNQIFGESPVKSPAKRVKKDKSNNLAKESSKSQRKTSKESKRRSKHKRDKDEHIEWKPPKDDSIKKVSQVKSFKIPKKNEKSAENRNQHHSNADILQGHQINISPVKEKTRQQDSMKSFKIPKKSDPSKKIGSKKSPAKRPKHCVSEPTGLPSPLRGFRIPKKSNLLSPESELVGQPVLKIPRLSAKNVDVHTFDVSNKTKEDSSHNLNHEATVDANPDITSNSDHDVTSQANPDISSKSDQDTTSKSSQEGTSKSSKKTDEDRKAAKVRKLQEALKNLDRQIEVNRALKKLSESATYKDLKKKSGNEKITLQKIRNMIGKKPDKPVTRKSDVDDVGSVSEQNEPDNCTKPVTQKSDVEDVGSVSEQNEPDNCTKPVTQKSDVEDVGSVSEQFDLDKCTQSVTQKSTQSETQKSDVEDVDSVSEQFVSIKCIQSLQDSRLSNNIENTENEKNKDDTVSDVSGQSPIQDVSESINSKAVVSSHGPTQDLNQDDIVEKICLESTTKKTQEESSPAEVQSSKDLDGTTTDTDAQERAKLEDIKSLRDNKTLVDPELASTFNTIVDTKTRTQNLTHDDKHDVCAINTNLPDNSVRTESTETLPCQSAIDSETLPCQTGPSKATDVSIMDHTYSVLSRPAIRTETTSHESNVGSSVQTSTMDNSVDTDNDHKTGHDTLTCSINTHYEVDSDNVTKLLESVSDSVLSPYSSTNIETVVEEIVPDKKYDGFSLDSELGLDNVETVSNVDSEVNGTDDMQCTTVTSNERQLSSNNRSFERLQIEEKVFPAGSRQTPVDMTALFKTAAEASETLGSMFKGPWGPLNSQLDLTKFPSPALCKLETPESPCELAMPSNAPITLKATSGNQETNQVSDDLLNLFETAAKASKVMSPHFRQHADTTPSTTVKSNRSQHEKPPMKIVPNLFETAAKASASMSPHFRKRKNSLSIQHSSGSASGTSIPTTSPRTYKPADLFSPSDDKPISPIYPFKDNSLYKTVMQASLDINSVLQSLNSSSGAEEPSNTPNEGKRPRSFSAPTSSVMPAFISPEQVELYNARKQPVGDQTIKDVEKPPTSVGNSITRLPLSSTPVTELDSDVLLEPLPSHSSMVSDFVTENLPSKTALSDGSSQSDFKLSTEVSDLANVVDQPVNRMHYKPSSGVLSTQSGSAASNPCAATTNEKPCGAVHTRPGMLKDFKSKLNTPRLDTEQHIDCYTCKLQNDGQSIKMKFFKSPPGKSPDNKSQPNESPPKIFKSPPRVNRKDMPNEQLDQVQHQVTPSKTRLTYSGQKLKKSLTEQYEASDKVDHSDVNTNIHHDISDIIPQNTGGSFLENVHDDDGGSIKPLHTHSVEPIVTTAETLVYTSTSVEAGSSHDIADIIPRNTCGSFLDHDLYVDQSKGAVSDVTSKVADQPVTTSAMLPEQSVTGHHSIGTSVQYKGADMSSSTSVSVHKKPSDISLSISSNNPNSDGSLPAAGSLISQFEKPIDQPFSSLSMQPQEDSDKDKPHVSSIQSRNLFDEILLPKKFTSLPSKSNAVCTPLKSSADQVEASNELIMTSADQIRAPTYVDSVLSTKVNGKSDIDKMAHGHTSQEKQDCLTNSGQRTPRIVYSTETKESPVTTLIAQIQGAQTTVDTGIASSNVNVTSKQSSSVISTQTDGVSTESPLPNDLLNLSLNASGSLTDDDESISSSILGNDQEFVIWDEIPQHSTPIEGEGTQSSAVKETAGRALSCNSGRVSQESTASTKGSLGSQPDEWLVVESISEVESELNDSIVNQVEKVLQRKYLSPSYLSGDTKSGNDTIELDDSSHVLNIEWMESLPNSEDDSNASTSTKKIVSAALRKDKMPEGSDGKRVEVVSEVNSGRRVEVVSKESVLPVKLKGMTTQKVKSTTDSSSNATILSGKTTATNSRIVKKVTISGNKTASKSAVKVTGNKTIKKTTATGTKTAQKPGVVTTAQVKSTTTLSSKTSSTTTSKTTATTSRIVKRVTVDASGNKDVKKTTVSGIKTAHKPAGVTTTQGVKLATTSSSKSSSTTRARTTATTCRIVTKVTVDASGNKAGTKPTGKVTGNKTIRKTTASGTTQKPSVKASGKTTVKSDATSKNTATKQTGGVKSFSTKVSENISVGTSKNDKSGKTAVTRTDTKKPSTSGSIIKKPSTSGDNTRKPSTSGDYTRKPSTSGDNTRKASTSGDNTRKASTSGDSTRKASTSGDNTRKPSSSGDNTRRPSTSGDNNTASVKGTDKDRKASTSSQQPDQKESKKEEVKAGGGKAQPQKAESRSSARNHPYQRKPRQSNQPNLSKHLVVPELHELMQNFTNQSYMSRRVNRLTIAKDNFFSKTDDGPGRFKDMGEAMCSGIAIKLNEKKYDTNIHKDTAQQRRTRVEALEERLQRVTARRPSSRDYNRDSEFYEQGPGPMRGAGPRGHRLPPPDHFRERPGLLEPAHPYQIRMPHMQQGHDQAMLMQHEHMQRMQHDRMQAMFQDSIRNISNQWYGGGQPPGPWRC